jgi:UDP-N-acetylmuramyl-tripeptide synthetase
MDTSRFTVVTSDSREVKPGALFVAVKGAAQDGHDFIDDVISKGAVAVIGEQKITRSLSVPYTQVVDSRLALANAAAEFYKKPSHTLKVAGVTGTSGKTTCTYILESILRAAGHKVGVIGTVNFRYDAQGREVIVPSTHTTPGPVELQKLLAMMKSQGVTHVVMEVSSHALSQRRVFGIEFDAAAFTNLSPEHLDFHKNMEDYFQAKKILFTDLFQLATAAGKKPVAVTNAEDEYGRKLAQAVPGILTYSVSGPANISGEQLSDGVRGISGTVTVPEGSLKIRSSLMGRFNISNLLTAIGLAKGLGVSHSAIGEGIKRLKGVPGRLERVPNSKGIHVFVDYAHKPGALDKVLANLQSFRQGQRLITVMGCGGDRDRTKRPLMGKIAQTLSDYVLVTSDNPRTEDPDQIIQEILKGMSPQPPFRVEPDRRKAIFAAISLARPGDLVLIAGKGHEDYQIIGTEKHPFDDRKVAAEALS